MAVVTREHVMERLATVQDPELHKDLVSLDMIKDVAIDGTSVRVHVVLTTPACPLKEKIATDVTHALTQLPGVEHVHLEWSAEVRSTRNAPTQLPGVKNIVAVGAGKGGVGKSTVAVLLATGLHRAGATVGLMDADVYGPSIPTMMGVDGATPAVKDGVLVPIDAGGIRVMSIGFMVDTDKALIWRGPMVHGVIKQFLEQVTWGELDYLVVDLPPGTGDVPLTLAQSIPMTGSLIVCTPQEVALMDARRAVRMYQQLNVGCLGMIENMSYYLCPSCGHRDELFAHGGAARAAESLGVPFMGEIPLNVAVRIHTDGGAVDRIFDDADDYVRRAIDTVVSNVAGQVSMQSMREEQTPTLSIE
ncbi:MAG: Mrp/NBP35 family ATP-binding protein [Phycisphaerae bacterium]